MHHFKTTKPKKKQKLNPPIVEFLFRDRGSLRMGFFFHYFTTIFLYSGKKVEGVIPLEMISMNMNIAANAALKINFSIYECVCCGKKWVASPPTPRCYVPA